MVIKTHKTLRSPSKHKTRTQISVFVPCRTGSYVSTWRRERSPSVHAWHMSKPVMTFVFMSKCYGMDCFGTYFTHVQSCDVTRGQSATEWTASVHTSHSHTCPKLWWRSCQSATEWIASVIRHTCPKLWCNPCSKSYGVDCFGTYFTHVQSCDDVSVKVLRNGPFRSYVTHVQSCDDVRVHVKVLRNGLLRYIFHTCPKLWCNLGSKCYGVDCFGTYVTQSHMSKAVMTFVSKCYGMDPFGHTSHMSKAVM